MELVRNRGKTDKRGERERNEEEGRNGKKKKGVCQLDEREGGNGFQQEKGLERGVEKKTNSGTGENSQVDRGQ